VDTRGELNSPFQVFILPSLLVRLLDQLTTLGETAALIKESFKGEIIYDILLQTGGDIGK
jgi:hypothetical protein